MAAKKTKKPASTATRDTRLVDRVRSLNQRHSKREIARMLGVHERSVRRWLTGERKPEKLKQKPVAAKLSGALKKDRKTADREYRKAKIPKLGVAVPPPARRITYEGETEPSKTVEMGVRETLVSGDVFKMLKNYRTRQVLKGEKARVRFMGIGGSDSEYPNEFYWSPWENITRYTDEEIDEFLESLNLEFDKITKIRIDV